jgi:hypothetical protein
MRIDGEGLITTNFKVERVPPKTKELSWSRRGLCSVYPPDHIGRTMGVANKIRPTGIEKYRAPPSWSWTQDTKDFFLFGKDDAGGQGTNDFRSQKQNIWFASGIISRTGVRARAESEGRHAVRAEIRSDRHIRLNIYSARAYPELDWGNECPALPASPVYEGCVRVRLRDKDSIDLTSQDA